MNILAGWWLTYPSEKYEFVSWDDDIPNWMESHKIPWFQTTNQSNIAIENCPFLVDLSSYKMVDLSIVM